MVAAALPEIGLDAIVMSDGPIGVRGGQWRAGDPSVALPSPTALAATLVEAEPGQSVAATMSLPGRAFEVWEGGWRTVEGGHVVRAGRNAADLPLAVTVKI
ncbi:hypothetical protein AB0K18_01695 [Nonomuraea sp. NPDC049421]|uniref:hypothetical protein n=1 Tax=Nonomuraea sp. NPDC049421 TaxID=3155275 RepID=UPI00344960FA